MEVQLHVDVRMRQKAGTQTTKIKSAKSFVMEEAATFYKRLADLLSSKRQNPYPAVMGWLRCRLSFASICSAIMCIVKVSEKCM